jgi:hypothetical protein
MNILPSLERAGLALGIAVGIAAAAPSQDGPAAGTAPLQVWREARANTFTSSQQQFATLALRPDGTTLVAWESRRQRAGYAGVYLQRFDPDGRPLGGETPIHPAAGQLHQRVPALSASRSGVEWAAWEEHSERGAVLRIRRLDGAGHELRELAAGASAPSIAALEDGGAVVAFLVGGRVAVQRVDAAGEPAGPLLEPGGDARGHAPQVTATADGGFLVAWAALGEAGFAPDGLRARRYDREGRAADLLAFDGGEPRGSIEPSLAATADGGFVVAWMDGGAGRGRYAVLAQRFGADDRACGEPILVADDAGWLSGATVAAAPDSSGRFCVAWNASETADGGPDDDIFARLFAADGSPCGPAFPATARREGDQRLVGASGARALAFGADDRVALAWSGDGGRGDAAAVHLSWLGPASADLEAAGATLTAAADEEPSGIESGALAEVRPIALSTEGPHDPPVFTGSLPQLRGAVWAEDGTGFTAITNTGWTPPDTVAATGPAHVAVLVNGGVGFFDKAGNRSYFQTLNNFLGVASSTFVFDPRVVFDTLSGRWFCAATEHVNQTQGFFVLAVSDDDDPNGSWYRYRLDVTGIAGTYFVDFPHLGITDDAVYLTSNNFPNGRFRDHLIYILPKQPLLSGQPVTARFTLTAQTASASTGLHVGTGGRPFFVNVSSGRTLRIWTIRDPLTAPTLVSASLSIPSYSGAGRVPQLGTSTTLSAVDTRMSILQVRDGSLWVCHNTDSPVVTRWYQVAVGDWPNAGSPQLVQNGVISAGSAGIFLPSINVDAYGNALVCASKSSSTETPSLVYYWRNAGDAAGTMQGPVTVQTSPASYTRSSRWGDYSAVQVDPRDGATFWMTHELAADPTNWSTHVEPHRIQAPTFTADTAVVPTATGGTVTFSLDNPAGANRGYLLLASASGDTPGLRLPGGAGIVNLDLNLDGFSVAALGLANTPTFANFSGALDGNGRATAQFVVPPLPGITGVDLWFAYAQDPATDYDFASETLRIRLQ